MRNRAAVVAGLVIACTCAAQGIIATRTVPNPIANFDISYIDITLKGNGPTLFHLQYTPSATGAVGLYKVHFLATCVSEVVNGTLLEAETGIFSIPQSGMNLTSNEFFTDDGPDSPGLHRTIRRLDPSAQTALFGIGMIPSGRITLQFTLMTSDGSPVPGAAATVWFDIVAVRYVKLIAPGVDAHSRADKIPETFTPFPQFVWSSDLLPISYPPGSVKFTVAVFEDPQGTMNPSDIPDSRPIWSETIDGQSTVNYAQYPAGGARALEPGVVYYWQVRAVLQGPVNREVASELYSFRVGDLNSAGVLSPSQHLILRYLSMILGPNFGYVMGQLKGHSPLEAVLLDGAAVDIERLARIAEDYVLGKRMVTHVEVK